MPLAASGAHYPPHAKAALAVSLGAGSEGGDRAPRIVPLGASASPPLVSPNVKA